MSLNSSVHGPLGLYPYNRCRALWVNRSRYSISVYRCIFIKFSSYAVFEIQGGQFYDLRGPFCDLRGPFCGSKRAVLRPPPEPLKINCTRGAIKTTREGQAPPPASLRNSTTGTNGLSGKRGSSKLARRVIFRNFIYYALVRTRIPFTIESNVFLTRMSIVLVALL